MERFNFFYKNLTMTIAVKAAMATDEDITALAFMCVNALDAVPVLQRFVEQHLNAVPPQTPDEQTYVFVEHDVPDGTHV
jgi:hypothetical protein